MQLPDFGTEDDFFIFFVDIKPKRTGDTGLWADITYVNNGIFDLMSFMQKKAM